MSTDIIKGQYHGDVVVPVLRNVTVKGEYGSYINKTFERPHYSYTIRINIRDETGDLVAFEHVITLHFRRAAGHSISFEMVFPLTRLDSMGYDNKPYMTYGWTVITHKPFQKSLPYKEEVMYLFIMDQCCKEDMDSEEFLKSVARSVMPSLKEIG